MLIKTWSIKISIPCYFFPSRWKK